MFGIVDLRAEPGSIVGVKNHVTESDHLACVGHRNRRYSCLSQATQALAGCPSSTGSRRSTCFVLPPSGCSEVSISPPRRLRVLFCSSSSGSKCMHPLDPSRDVFPYLCSVLPVARHDPARLIRRRLIIHASPLFFTGRTIIASIVLFPARLLPLSLESVYGMYAGRSELTRLRCGASRACRDSWPASARSAV